MYDEYETSALLSAFLSSTPLNLSPSSMAITGLVADINGEKIGAGEKKTVVLRADMDALALNEETNLSFSSQNRGTMHACGHDAHMTMVLGAALLLHQFRHEWQGTVRLIFQPAEEGGAGGRRMVEEGALEGASAALALHVSPSNVVGTIASKAGPILAGTRKLKIALHGRGGHAAMPETTNDPVAAGAAIVTALHGIVSRLISPADAAVVSITKIRTGSLKGGSFQTGEALNIIPDDVEIGGTVRALKKEVMERVWQAIEERVHSIAKAFGCTATIANPVNEGLRSNSKGIAWQPYPYPPTVNDKRVFELGMRKATELFGADNVVELSAASMAGEDFSFLLEESPGALFWIGSRNPAHAHGEKTGSNLHSPTFDVDEGILVRGSVFLATSTLELLSGSNDIRVEL